MKNLLVLSSLVLASAVAQAGDNGFYDKCRSASGRTQLVVGHVGGYDAGESVQLTIDGKSLGQLVVESSVLKQEIDENTVRYREADHDGLDLVTIKRLPLTARDLRNDTAAIEILSGEDPRTNKPLEVKILVTCKTVYNPI